jgi:Zinc knuckle
LVKDFGTRWYQWREKYHAHKYSSRSIVQYADKLKGLYIRFLNMDSKTIELNREAIEKALQDRLVSEIEPRICEHAWEELHINRRRDMTLITESLEENRTAKYISSEGYADYGARKRSGKGKLWYKVHEYCNHTTENGYNVTNRDPFYNGTVDRFNRRAEKMKYTKCFICQQMGHIAAECKAPLKK